MVGPVVSEQMFEHLLVGCIGAAVGALLMLLVDWLYWKGQP